jgi:hypothetical protein
MAIVLLSRHDRGKLGERQQQYYVFRPGAITSTNLNSSGFGGSPDEAAADCSDAGFASLLAVAPVGTFNLTTPFKAK